MANLGNTIIRGKLTTIGNVIVGGNLTTDGTINGYTVEGSLTSTATAKIPTSQAVADYVTSAINTWKTNNARTSSNLTASGATVSVPAGYYASTATKTINNGAYSAGVTLTAGNGTASLTLTDNNMGAVPSDTKGTYFIQITGSGSGTVTGYGTATIGTAGYLTTGSINSSSNSKTSNTGSATKYYNINAGSCTVSGGGLSQGTASGGGLSGGGLTAGNGSVSVSGTSISLTESSSKPSSGYYITATGSGSVSRAAINRAAFSQTVTRADITDTHTAGYIPAKSATTVIGSASSTVSLAAGSIAAASASSNTATKYYTLPASTCTVSGGGISTNMATSTTDTGYYINRAAVTDAHTEGYTSAKNATNVINASTTYIAKSSTGSAVSNTSDTATVTLEPGQQTTIGSGYYGSNRIIRASSASSSSVSPASGFSAAITDKTSAVTVGTLSSGYYPITVSSIGVTFNASTAGWFSSGTATDTSAQVGVMAAGACTISRDSGATSSITKDPGASTSVSGMVTTDTNTGYSVTASANSGIATASVGATYDTHTAGYIPAKSKTQIYAASSSTTAEKTASSTKYIQAAVLSAAASISTTPVVTPSIAGTITNITTTTAPTSGTNGTDYWTIDPSGSVTTTGVAKASAGTATEGYCKGKTATGTANITPSIGAGTNRYLSKATCTVSGGGLSQGTASGGGLSGGGLTAGNGSVSVSGTSVSLTEVSSKPSSGYYITATGSGSVSRAAINRAAFSQTVTRADITKSHTAGYMPAQSATTAISSASSTVSLAAGSIAAASASSNTATKYYTLPAASFSNSGSATASATTTVSPGAITISATSTTVSAADKITVTPITDSTTLTEDGLFFVSINATAAANSSGAQSAISGSGSCSCSIGAGYTGSTTSNGSVSVSGTATAKTSSKTSSTYYIPLNVISVGVSQSGSGAQAPTVSRIEGSSNGEHNASGGDPVDSPSSGHAYIGVNVGATSYSNTFSPNVISDGYGTTSKYSSTPITRNFGSQAVVKYFPVHESSYALSLDADAAAYHNYTVSIPVGYITTAISKEITPAILGLTSSSSIGTVSGQTVIIPAYTYYTSTVTRTVGNSKPAATYNTSTSDQTIATGYYTTGIQTILAAKATCYATSLGTSGRTTTISPSIVKKGWTIEFGDVNNYGRIASITGTYVASSSSSTTSGSVSPAFSLSSSTSTDYDDATTNIDTITSQYFEINPYAVNTAGTISAGTTYGDTWIYKVQSTSLTSSSTSSSISGKTLLKGLSTTSGSYLYIYPSTAGWFDTSQYIRIYGGYPTPYTYIYINGYSYYKSFSYSGVLGKTWYQVFSSYGSSGLTFTYTSSNTRLISWTGEGTLPNSRNTSTYIYCVTEGKYLYVARRSSGNGAILTSQSDYSDAKPVTICDMFIPGGYYVMF